jgi:hypothetical protein
MARKGLDTPVAFERLCRQARSSGRPTVVDLASDVLAQRRGVRT